MTESESPIREDEEVLFFPTYGKLSPDGKEWRFRVHGWIFEPEEDSTVRKATLRTLRRTLGLEGKAAETELFRARARWFLVDNERGKRVPIRLGESVIRLTSSTSNGHFDGDASVSVAEAAKLRGKGEKWLSYEAVVPSGDTRRFAGRVYPIAESGWSVISDIDDTIKITDVHDRSKMIRNTFLRPYASPPGMADLYQAWDKSVSGDELSVHYVSNSPWQLYKYLDELVTAAGFPSGTIHLRVFRWKDRSLIDFLRQGSKHKDETIEKLLRSFPKRRFVLVGDTGERDPEIYGEFARKFPEQVARVFLRVPTGEAKVDARLKAAMRDVSAEKWQIFSDPAEVAWRP